MNLGQSMLVIGAITLLGLLVLNANSTLLETSDTISASEVGITAVSLATSIVEEAEGKMFDEKIADSSAAPITSPAQFSDVLGPEGGEAYRGGTKGFNDFDDFNGLFLVYKSDAPGDTANSPDANCIVTIPGLRGRFYLTASVCWVDPMNLDSTSTAKTNCKKIVVSVWSPGPGSKDTLRFPAIMSYWK